MNTFPVAHIRVSMVALAFLLALPHRGAVADPPLSPPAAPDPHPSGVAARATEGPAALSGAARTGESGALSAAAAGTPTSTSSTPPQVRSFSAKATPVRDYPRVASTGRCAPAYRNGSHGACIADKPCRGYGIRNDQNQVLCMCFLAKGGCDANSRCDTRVHACVADSKEPEETE